MDDEDDIYIVCGTPLPDLDEDAVLKKKAVQDLTVRDDQGRQRFHGAFTGGFSAGYFNTVGTKEGWEPSTFVSSRAKKASSSGFQQKPEDFMDGEDFGEFGIAPKVIRMTSNFHDPAADSQKKRKHVPAEDGVIPGEAPLKDIVKPVLESIGIQILQKMGWRQGQGIGPRIRRQKDVKVYGCSIGPLGSELQGDNPMFSDLTFAPDESPDVQYVPKDDFHGIGYSGLSTRSIFNSSDMLSASTTKSWLPKEKRKLAISGQAFGVGALEDDDDDIYTKEDMSQYDFSELKNDKCDEGVRNSSSSKDLPFPACQVLEGFCSAEKPCAAKKHYPVPDLPPDFQPKHLGRKVCAVDSSTLGEVTKHKLNPTVRSVLLGEQVSVKQSAIVQHEQSQSLKSRFSKAPDEDMPLFPPGLVGTLSPEPFSRNMEKQKRYEKFLQASCDKDYLKLVQPPSMTEWEKQQELDEFTKTAFLYKPFAKGVKAQLESRSTSCTEPMIKFPELKRAESSKAEPQKVTKGVCREMYEWRPVSLLCKRFNVPNPYPDSESKSGPHSEGKKFLFDSMIFRRDVSASESPREESKTAIGDKKPSQVGKVESGDNSAEKSEIDITGNSSEKSEGTREKTGKPPMDLFKDIFKSSSSEDSELSENEAVEEPPCDGAASVGQAEKPLDSITEAVLPTDESSKKREAFGVFANLDLDALNKRKPLTNSIGVSSGDNSSASEAVKERNHTSESHCQKTSADTQVKALKSAVPQDCYGPEPPPPDAAAAVLSRTKWTSKHSKHKHHKKEKKRKRKKKKKHSRKSDEDSSSDSEEDVPAELIIKKLKKLQKTEDRHRNRF